MLANDTTTVDAACSEAVDTAEYHVMVRKGKCLDYTLLITEHRMCS
jgi:hypothetical protein